MSEKNIARNTTKDRVRLNMQTFLPKDVHEDMRVYCFQNRITYSNFIAQAIIEKLERERGNAEKTEEEPTEPNPAS